jgi:nitrite reductase/ring-hydroxylating ferredoxin subunit
MLTHEQNDLLTRIEGRTAMGQLMRDYCWIPFALSMQLVPDGPPRRVRLLGTDYVAFRDSTHRVGFLDEGCPHRNASLVLARNEECGLRCIFHGWKVDATGQVIEAPTHTPNPDAFAAKIKTRSYPTVDAGGLLWVWLGESEPALFPHLPFTTLPDSHVWVTATQCACNWLQGVEATLDTAHIGTLHKAYMEAYSANDSASSIAGTLASLAPRYDVEDTDYGIDAIGIRPLGDGSRYVRTTKWVMPFVSLVPGSPGSSGRDVDGVIFIVSPIDDTHHQLFFGFWANDFPINDGLYLGVPEAQRAVVGDRPFDVNNFGGFSGGREDNWGQDREAMARGHFSGFTGNLLQEDTVTQISMGPIVDRTREHLSSSDVAIIHARRALLEAVERVQQGQHPLRQGAPPTLLHCVPTDVTFAAGDSDRAAAPA